MSSAWPFYRKISGVRLCWALEEPKGSWRPCRVPARQALTFPGKDYESFSALVRSSPWGRRLLDSALGNPLERLAVERCLRRSLLLYYSCKGHNLNFVSTSIMSDYVAGARGGAGDLTGPKRPTGPRASRASPKRGPQTPCEDLIRRSIQIEYDLANEFFTHRFYYHFYEPIV